MAYCGNELSRFTLNEYRAITAAISAEPNELRDWGGERPRYGGAAPTAEVSPCSKSETGYALVQS